jgi:RNA polymerase sigma-70 factor (ECF subfamily)
LSAVQEEAVDVRTAGPLDPARLPDHASRLYRAAYALAGSGTEAEDLVQETFARVLSRPRRVRLGGERA